VRRLRSDGAKWPGAAAGSAQADFERAAQLDASSPDPHLALGATAGLRAAQRGASGSGVLEAERRGYRAGPREAEEQADAWLYRAEQEIQRARQPGTTDEAVHKNARRRLRLQALRDFQRARNLYEPVSTLPE